MTQKHTPAPWIIGSYRNNNGDYLGLDEIDECSCITIHDGIISAICWIPQAYIEEDDTSVFTEEKVANAHLIAAAPELLEECEKQLTWLRHIKPQIKAHDSVMIGFKQAEKHLSRVIAKAKGES